MPPLVFLRDKVVWFEFLMGAFRLLFLWEKEMDFFGKYQSPFGYMSGDNGVDSYGVDHSGFSTQCGYARRQA